MRSASVEIVNINFKIRTAAIREKNKFCTAQELHLRRATEILERVGVICDCRYISYRPSAIEHIASMALEISDAACYSDSISALAINPLVLFLK